MRGASILAAAGKPDSYIMFMGRWKSSAFMRYIRWAVTSMDDALSVLSDPRIYSMENMRRLNAGVELCVGEV